MSWRCRSSPLSPDESSRVVASRLPKPDLPPHDPPWWNQLGPGLITGAADDDPSGIATYSQGGAQFGYNMAWTVVLSYPLMVAIQLASARIGRVTGKGLAENFSRFCPRAVVQGLVGLLVVANVVNLGADLNAMGDAAALLLGGGKAWYALGFAIVSLLLQVFLPYARYIKILKWLTLSLLAYVGVAFAAHVDWLAALRAAVFPQLQWRKDYVTTVVAILGTTISPYLFFWQAAQEVEDIKRIPTDHPLRIAPLQSSRHLRRLRIDTWAGMGFSNLVALFIIVASAATLHVQGITTIETTTQAALALKPIAGEFAFLLFAAGVIGTGMLALPVLAGSAAYELASVLHVRKGLDRPLSAARPYYAILAVAVLVGLVIGLTEVNPIRALYWSAVINAVISVPIMVAVMLAAGHPRLMGANALPRSLKLLGWGATAVMAVATVAMFVNMAL